MIVTMPLPWTMTVGAETIPEAGVIWTWLPPAATLAVAWPLSWAIGASTDA